MKKEVFDCLLEDADTFSKGDLWSVYTGDEIIHFSIQNKNRWWIEAYCLTDHTKYKISRRKEVK